MMLRDKIHIIAWKAIHNMAPISLGNSLLKTPYLAVHLAPSSY